MTAPESKSSVRRIIGKEREIEALNLRKSGATYAEIGKALGIKVFVDLNVAEQFRELNLLGVPLDWKAWATRGYSERMGATEREYKAACERAGTDSILFSVYGGGKKVKSMCQSNGWLWFAEQEDAKNG